MSNSKTVFLILVLIFFLTGCSPAITPQNLTRVPPTARLAFSETVHPTAPASGTPPVFASTLTASPTASRINSSNAPVTLPSLSRSGITITLQKVSNEADKLVIDYQITGLPVVLFQPERARVLSSQPAEDQTPEQVFLPDNSLLKFVGGGCFMIGAGPSAGAGDGAHQAVSCKVTFAPLPAGVNALTFNVHRFQNALHRELPEDWQLPINLAPLSSSQATNVVQTPDLPSQPVGGITLRMLKASQASDKTTFQFGLQWEGAHRMLHHMAPITLQDSRDRYYILSSGNDSGSASIDHPNFSSLPSLITYPLKENSRLTFRLGWIVISATSQAGLHFDPVKNEKVGQEWVLDEKINASGFDLHFTKARLKKALDGTLMLEFDVTAPQDVVAVNLSTKDGPPQSESGMDLGRGVLVSRVSLATLPIQSVDLTISEVLYKVIGPWEITWKPQQVDASVSPAWTPAPTRLAGPAPTLVPNAPLLSELQTLLQKAYTDNWVGTGWVHQVVEQDLAENINVLDSGDTLQQPRQSRVETWYHLDRQGYVQTTINIRKSMDGKMFSVDLDSGIYHFSLPEGQSGISQDIYLAKPSFALDIISNMNNDLANGASIHQENVMVSGNTCRLYEVTQPYNPPQIFEGEPAPVQATRYSVCVDPVNGKVVQIQTQMVYTDGSSRSKDTSRWISVEEVDTLPDEVNDLLQKVIMP